MDDMYTDEDSDMTHRRYRSGNSYLRAMNQPEQIDVIAKGWDFYREFRAFLSQDKHESDDIENIRYRLDEMGRSILANIVPQNPLFVRLLFQLKEISAIIPDALGVIYTYNIELEFPKKHFTRSKSKLNYYTSIAEQVIKAVFIFAVNQPLHANRQAHDKLLLQEWAIGVFDKFRPRFASSNHRVKYMHAKLLCNAQRFDEARTVLKNVIDDEDQR